MTGVRSLLPALGLKPDAQPETNPAANPAACAACEVSRRGFVSMTTLAALGMVVGACGGGTDSPSAPSNPTGPGGGGGGGGGGSNPPATLPTGVVRNGNVFTIDLTASNDLLNFGVMVLGGAATPALVVRAAPDTFRAFDARCPHAGTANQWQVGGGLLQCNNHGSRFAALDGALNTGPATMGLTTLASTRSGTTLTVTAG
jgi:cytochrome b6-f complex iron-sulfur subunit